MMDYKLNLLSCFIEAKLGLKQKRTKAQSVINAMIFDITRESRDN